MKLLKLFILTLLLCKGNFLLATHIAGGEFTITHAPGFNSVDYKISLILYYDIEKGLDPADTEIQISIFKTSNDQFVEDFLLFREPNPLLLEFANPKCKDQAFGISAYRYSQVVQLSPFQYNDPSGYYASWERCCRNGGINNVQSNSMFEGMAFYLEFPSPRDYPGNSLPVFDPVVREYFCPGEVSFFSAAATDADGDSLLYSLQIPRKGKAQSNGATVLGQPKPYPLLEDYVPLPGFNGNPGLEINARTGEVTIAPANQGIFVFAVRCEEFKDGIKTGEVTRDFEVVVQNCLLSEAPSMQLIPSGWDRPYVFGTDTIFVRDTADFCHQIFVSDPDPNEELTIGVNPSSAQGSAFSITPNLLQKENGEYPSSEICTPLCIEAKDSVELILSIEVEDEACPKGNKFIQQVRVIPAFPENNTPTISTDFDGSTSLPNQEMGFSVFGSDLDLQDVLSLELIDQGILEQGFGMKFESTRSQGEVQGDFTWTPDCRINGQERFELLFLARDEKCNGDVSDSLIIELEVDLSKEGAFEIKPLQNYLTPNGDGNNDRLDLRALPNYECAFGKFAGGRIYDRWGGLIAKFEPGLEEWDPGNIAPGVYFYSLEFENEPVVGFFHLLR